MSKLLAASLACLLLIPVAAFAQGYSDREHSDDPFWMSEEDQAHLNDQAEKNDPFGNAEAGRVRATTGRLHSGRPGMGERAMGRGGVNVDAAKAAVAARGGAGFVGFQSGVPGRFTIVANGDLEILLDTSSGKSWRLVQSEGTRWIAIDKEGEDVDPFAAPSHSAPGSPQAVVEAITLEKHVRRLNNVLEMETARNRELERAVAEANAEIRRLTEGVFKYRDEVAELKKQLKEAKNTLNARPEPAPAQPTAASKGTDPFGGF